ncbi:MAG: hypothetical protein E4H01_12215 [Lysobacterales bacterium]|nr:MAG: hypothetical protein E4H01_12215 [Xanthomonadales bacterium]
MKTLRLVLSILAWPFLLVGGTLLAYLWPLVIWLFSERLRFSISEGDLFEVSSPLRVFILTHWEAPYTGGFKCKLPVGVYLRAVTTAPKGSRGCRFVPAEPSEFLTQFVPQKERTSPQFSGVSLPLSTRAIRRHLQRGQAV